MTTRHMLILCLSLLPAFACQKSAPPASETEQAPAAAPANAVQSFGAAITAGDAVALADILGKPAEFDAKDVLTEGTVKQVCQTKGCWMELTETGTENPAACRITFKDYAFFVPKDAKGKLARIQGTVQTKILSKEDVDHLEAEGATFAHKLPDGTAKQLSLVASGVELRDQI